MPRCPIVNGCRSSAVLVGLATPIAPTEEVWTTRFTSAASASSSTILVPRTFVSKTPARSEGRSEVRPAM